MVKIQNIDEFKSITGSDSGFVVIFDGASNTMHQTKCTNLTEDVFSNQDGNSLHWFSTIALAEKSFAVTQCESCKPKDY
jgi:NAD-dependent SIR2 family protein deacetylase